MLPASAPASQLRSATCTTERQEPSIVRKARGVAYNVQQTYASWNHGTRCRNEED
ncbi:MAG: hypothetical protein KGL39_36110 [Patescibacteria group bacterium]|nr:hypothetical protein [Patescibacteria group bacterium]